MLMVIIVLLGCDAMLCGRYGLTFDSNLHSHCCEKLNFHKFFYIYVMSCHVKWNIEEWSEILIRNFMKLKIHAEKSCLCLLLITVL